MESLIRAGALQGFESLLRGLGADPRKLLKRYGIDPVALEDPERLISLEATAQMLEESARLTACPDFGLRLAARQDAGMLGLLAIVIQNAPTTAQAVADASRYLFLHSPAYAVVVDEKSLMFKDCFCLRFEIRLPEFFQQRQLIDGCLGLTYQLCRLLGRDRFRLGGVSLPHTPMATESVYRHYFGAPIAFAQPYAALHVHRDALQATLADVNPLLRQMTLEYIARHFPSRNLSHSDRVRQMLTRTLGAGRGTKTEVADMLGLHPRTLQRRLEDEGATFELIREEVYRTAVLRFLRETDLPLKQVAGVLGFSEPSALTRSCQRWFSKSPSQLRLGGVDAASSRKTGLEG